MNVTSRRFANAVVLHIDGRLDQDTCGDFTRELMTHVDSMAHGGGAVILDLSGLEYVSSAGLRCFMLASRQAKAQNGRIYVASLSLRVGYNEVARSVVQILTQHCLRRKKAVNVELQIDQCDSQQDSEGHPSVDILRP